MLSKLSSSILHAFSIQHSILASTTSCYNPLLFPAATSSGIQQHLLLFFPFLQQARRPVTTHSCFLQQHAATFSNICCFFSYSCNKHNVLLQPPLVSCSNMQRRLVISAAFSPFLQQAQRSVTTHSCFLQQHSATSATLWSSCVW